ncbi:MAG: DUF3820 family protein [Gemmataceae bacterium]|nr:DUF3820 family protein [Gemmataceae bacterium]
MTQTHMIELFREFEARELRHKPPPPSRAMRMPFGKHLGRPLDQVPRGYLRWVAANVAGLDPAFADAIGKAISGQPVPDEPPAPDFCPDDAD